MITKWKVFNFKSIQKETELTFAPLTIFAGANSSGKSTILQSILLISQTLAHKLGSRSVVLNGGLTRLGQFDDLRSFDSPADQIVIGWECRPENKELTDNPERMRLFKRRKVFLEQINCEISFDTDPGDPQRDLYQLQPRLFSCQLSVKSRDMENLDITTGLSITRTSDEQNKVRKLELDPENEPSSESLMFDLMLDPSMLEEIQEDYSSAEPVGCAVRHFLPERLAIRINETKEDAITIAIAICEGLHQAFGRGTMLPHNLGIPKIVFDLLNEILGDSIRDILPSNKQLSSLEPEENAFDYRLSDWFQGIERLSVNRKMEVQKKLQGHPDLFKRIVDLIVSDKGDHYKVIPFRLPLRIVSAVNYLDQFFTNSVKYLGPLRDEPKPLYPLELSPNPTDVGLRGELTAAVLDLYKNQLIYYLPSSHFQSQDVNTEKSLRTLESAVADWLKYLGVADNVKSQDRGKLGHELKVTLTDTGKPHDLTHVGVGVSQVLPILVSCLLAEPDTTLIFEQPELHLHPKVQTLLGDFFLSMALLGKQCLIETHSEYLINRLRLRAAAAPLEKDLTSRMKLYFVEKNEDTSTFREVVINEYGAILDWPEGFFDQSQLEAERILRAATKKRKEQRERNH
ncbi:MAG: DUF3696 domain-containing protein [Firmicutes bacterium]|nr:DUF3696 domain-containing protein [Bacillota bacterium]